MTDLPSLAHRLAEARRSGKLLEFQANLLPANVEEAMVVQAQVAREMGASVAGWKVGATPEGIPVAAPIFELVMHMGGARLRVGPSGRTGIEVEIALRLATDLPPRPANPYNREEILDAADAFLVGVELVEHRFQEPPKPPFLALLADNISNGAYLCGTPIKILKTLDLSRLLCTLRVDGRIVHEGIGGHASGDPLAPLIAYASKPCDQLGGLKAGHIITTGTLSGCPYFEGAVKVEATVESLGKVAVEILA